MSKPAFIVDGFTELKIIQKICPGSPVQRTDLNGKSVKISKIVERICQKIRIFGNRHYPIIILIDKEERNISFDVIANEIYVGIKEMGIKDEIIVGVADIMIENWILSDWLSFNGQIENKPKNCDGINGAALIKKTKGRYSKITDGVDFFIQNSADVMYENSASFRYFADQLRSLDCQFLKAIPAKAQVEE